MEGIKGEHEGSWGTGVEGGASGIVFNVHCSRAVETKTASNAQARGGLGWEGNGSRWGGWTGGGERELNNRDI